MTLFWFSRNMRDNIPVPQPISATVMEGLIGRYLSTSYSLKPQDDKYEEMISNLKDEFNTYQKDGKVTIRYTTKLYVGKLL